MKKISSRQKKRMIIEILPGAIVSLPIAIYLASAEIKYHPYWHSFIISYLGFWFLIFIGIWYYYFITAVKKAIRDAKNKSK